MVFDEGLAMRNGESLNIQCLRQKGKGCIPVQKSTYHYHRYIELIYIVKGKMAVWIGDEQVILCAEDVLVIYAGEIHCTCFAEESECIVVKFLPDILYSFGQSANTFEYMFNFGVRDKAERVIHNSTEIGIHLQSAMQAFSEKPYAEELFVRADITRVCAEILKIWKDRNEIVSVESTVNRENLALIQKTMQIVKDTNGNLKTHEAARFCGLSDGHFSRLFRLVMNTTFTKYVKSVKLAEAERLLICTDDAVADIAQALNYVSPSHFIEDFRKAKGVSPKQFRNKYTKNI